MKQTASQKLQLRAFELDLHGYKFKEIADILNKEFKLKVMTLTDEHIETLVKAETIAYALTSEIGY